MRILYISNACSKKKYDELKKIYKNNLSLSDNYNYQIMKGLSKKSHDVTALFKCEVLFSSKNKLFLLEKETENNIKFIYPFFINFQVIRSFFIKIFFVLYIIFWANKNMFREKCIIVDENAILTSPIVLLANFFNIKIIAVVDKNSNYLFKKNNDKNLSLTKKISSIIFKYYINNCDAYICLLEKNNMDCSNANKPYIVIDKLKLIANNDVTIKKKHKDKTYQYKKVLLFIENIVHCDLRKSNYSFFEKISLIGITIMSLLPNCSNRYIYGLLLLVWIICILPTVRNEYQHLTAENKVFISSVLLLIIIFVINYLLNRMNVLPSLMFSYIRILFSIIIGLFYALQKDNRNAILRSMCVITIIIVCYTGLKTFIYNIIYYNISRMLSTGIGANEKYRFSGITGIIGLGSYHYIYGVIYPIFIFTIVSLVNLKKRIINIHSISIMISLIISIICILKAEFMYSYVLLIIAFVLYIFKLNTVKKVAISMLIIIGLIFLTRNPLSNLFDNFSKLSNKPNIEMRFNDLAQFLRGNIDDTVDIKGRLDAYSISLNTFVDNPLIGIGYNQNDENLGMHSTLFDTLAEFGLIGGIAFMSLIISSLYTIWKQLIGKARDLFFYCSVIFVIFTLINNAILTPIFYFLYIIVPLFLNKMEVKNESIMDS